MSLPLATLNLADCSLRGAICLLYTVEALKDTGHLPREGERVLEPNNPVLVVTIVI